MTTSTLKRTLCLLSLLSSMACSGPEDEFESPEWRSLDEDLSEADDSQMMGDPCGTCASCAKWDFSAPLIAFEVPDVAMDIFREGAAQAIIPIGHYFVRLNFSRKEMSSSVGGPQSVRFDFERGSMGPMAGFGPEYELEGSPGQIFKLAVDGLERVEPGDTTGRLYPRGEIHAAAPLDEATVPLTLCKSNAQTITTYEDQQDED